MSIIDNIFEKANKALVFSLLFGYVILMVYLTTHYGVTFGIAATVIPLAAIFVIMVLKSPYWGFIMMFIVNYYISGLSRYLQFMPPGIVMDLFVILLMVSIVIQRAYGKNEYKLADGINPVTFAAFVWSLYCILEIINPHSTTPLAWFTNARGIGLYIFFVTFLACIILRKFEDMRKIVFIWAILSLTAVLKALIQKTFGFDYAENRWLYVDGGSVTHIIYSGIRYFSFFTDAANFGSGIAFSGVFFSIASFYYKETPKKIFYFITACACFYGMSISGTRGSLAVPFVGFALFIVLSKNFKAMILGGTILIAAIVFLKFTYIGQGNSYIRRMRSVFDTEDASLNVRLENQKKLKTYMMDKPFGVGIGMGRGSVTKYRTDPVLAAIPKDSWYVMVWVETGKVGLIVHLCSLLFIVFYGGYLVLFRLKDQLIKGFVIAIVAGLCGVYAASYSLEIMGQFPNGFVFFTCMAFIAMSPKYEKQLSEDRKRLELKSK